MNEKITPLKIFYFINGKYNIGIPIDCFIRNDEEFISFELNMNWHLHSLKCDNCKTFLSDMCLTKNSLQWHMNEKPFEKWFFTDGENFYQLITNDFSSNEHFSNEFCDINGIITKCKLKIKKCEASGDILKYFEDKENYEICGFIMKNRKMKKETIKNILRESILPKDIIITLPKNVSWSDYEKELELVKDGHSVLNFKVNSFPKTAVGNKCYLVYNGEIKGWMEIIGLSEKEFTCSTTGTEWKGKFIERSGPFNYITPIPMKGFQGFRYMTT